MHEGDVLAKKASVDLKIEVTMLDASFSSNFVCQIFNYCSFASKLLLLMKLDVSPFINRSLKNINFARGSFFQSTI